MTIHVEKQAEIQAAMEEFSKNLIERVAKAFGIDFATLARDHGFATGGVVRSNPIRTGEIPVILSRGYDIPASRYWPLRLVFHLGYNPQKLLEDHRGQVDPRGPEDDLGGTV